MCYTVSSFSDTMVSIQIGDKAVWKLVQTGVTLSTKSVLQLADDGLQYLGFQFLITARLTQDCLENLFSIVKSKNPVPTPREFKYSLEPWWSVAY